MKQDVRGLVADAYPAIAADLLRPLLKLMNQCREQCAGDLVKFLVILVVAIRTTMHRDFASRTPEELASGAMPVFPGLGANTRSIADALGIPKETVRRKVADLLETGWLVRQGGKLYFTARAYQQLAPVREQIESLAVRYHEIVAALLERAEGLAVGAPR